MKKLCLFFVFLVFPIFIFADVVNVDGIYYNLDVTNNTAEVTGNPNNLHGYYQGDINVPHKIKYKDVEYVVNAIGSYAFEYETSLGVVNLPEGIESIGSYAFVNCYNVTVNSADNWEALKRVGSFAFEGTPWYENSPDGFVYIGKVLYHYKGDMPQNYNLVIDEGVVSIGGAAFMDSYDKENDRIISISIPSSVEYIGDFAFYKCIGLTEVDIPGNVKIIGDNAFGFCTNLSKVKISDGVIKIIGGAFRNTSISSIELPNSLTYIGYTAFAQDNNLISLTIPNSVDSIGAGAFQDCANLETVVIGNGVKTLIEDIFSGCTKLKSVSLPQSITMIYFGVFANCTSLSSIDIPSSVTYLGYRAFDGCSSLDNVVIPESVKYIGCAAFRDCSSLINISIPSDVEYVDNMAFDNTPWYDVIPDGMVYIGKAAYKYKGKMPKNSSVFIKEGTMSISNEAFDSHEDLKMVNIPISVIKIGCASFRGCTGLESISIPKNVKRLDSWAFQMCSNLRKITVDADLPIELGDSTNPINDPCDVFQGVDEQECLLYVPDGSVELYKTTPGWNVFRNILPLSSSGINGTKNNVHLSKQYDLNGRCINASNATLEHLPRGVYIVNGKKIIK